MRVRAQAQVNYVAGSPYPSRCFFSCLLVSYMQLAHACARCQIYRPCGASRADQTCPSRYQIAGDCPVTISSAPPLRCEWFLTCPYFPGFLLARSRMRQIFPPQSDMATKKVSGEKRGRPSLSAEETAEQNRLLCLPGGL